MSASSNPKKLKALILAEKHYYLEALLQCLGPLGIRLHVMSAKEDLHVQLSRYCADYWICGSLRLMQEQGHLADTLNIYCRENRISVVVPTDFISTLLLSKIKKELHAAALFPTADPETLIVLNNKWEFMKSFEKKIPFPSTKRLDEKAHLDSLDLPFPLMAKRLDDKEGYGSSARRVDSPEELSAYALEKGWASSLLAQEYIPGKDIDLSVLAVDGRVLAWTIQEWLTEERLRFVREDRVLQIGEQIISSTRFTGIAHFDMRIDERDNSLKVLECNPRCWGSIEASAKRGVNFPYAGILAALGYSLDGRMNYKPGFYFPKRSFRQYFTFRVSIQWWITGSILRDLCAILSDPLPYLYFRIPKFLRKNLLIFSKSYPLVSRRKQRSLPVNPGS